MLCGKDEIKTGTISALGKYWKLDNQPGGNGWLRQNKQKNQVSPSGSIWFWGEACVPPSSSGSRTGAGPRTQPHPLLQWKRENGWVCRISRNGEILILYCELHPEAQRRLSGRPLRDATKVKVGSDRSVGLTQLSKNKIQVQGLGRVPEQVKIMRNVGSSLPPST